MPALADLDARARGYIDNVLRIARRHGCASVPPNKIYEGAVREAALAF